MDAADARLFFAQLEQRFAAEAPALNALDAIIGDGDHGSTMLRGARAASRATHALGAASASAVFKSAGVAFQNAAGGAGGTLIAQIFSQIGVAGEERTGLDVRALHEGLTNAVVVIQKLGRANPGDKTLLDALVPAVRALEASDARPEAAVAAARAGLEATRGMTACAGRARHVAAGGVGALDPGARSVVVILKTLAAIARDRGAM